MFNRILVAVDGSANARRAAKHAAYLASLQPGTVVEMIYVLDYDRTRSDVLQNAERDDLHESHIEKLEPIERLFQEQGVPYVLIIRHGDPGPTIVQYANEQPVDLIVIGSRGLNLFQEMVLGSVSHKVAKRAKAPVLIVK